MEESNTQRPLSPVLDRSKIIRRVKRKSRLKLANRFKNSENLTSCSSLDDNITSETLEDSITPSQTLSILAEVEKCEKLNNSSVIENEGENQGTLVFKESDFKTAGGKGFTFSEDALKKHSELFEDIFKENSICINRSKKLSFLSKNIEIKDEFPEFKGFTQLDIESVSKEIESFKIIHRNYLNFEVVDFNQDKCSENHNSKKTENRLFIQENKVGLNEEKNQFQGFRSASGNKINISENNLKRAESIYKSIDNEKLEENSDIIGMNKASKIDKNKLQENSLFKPELCLEKNTKNNQIGFQSASGNKIKISENHLKRAQSLYKSIDNESVAEKSDFRKNLNETPSKIDEKINFENKLLLKSEIPKENKENNSIGFQSASGNKINISETNLKRAENLYKSIDNEKLEENSDIIGINKALKIDKNKLQENSLFKSEICLEKNTKNNQIGFQSASGNRIKISENNLKQAENLYKSINNENMDEKSSEVNKTPQKTDKETKNSSTIQTPENTMKNPKPKSINKNKISNLMTSSENTPIGVKRSLGMSSLRHQSPIIISSDKLEKARKLFEDEPPEYASSTAPPAVKRMRFSSLNTTDDVTPIISTPIKKTAICSNNSGLLESTLTPIKLNSEKNRISDEAQDGRFIVCDTTGGDLEAWRKDLRAEIETLEMRIKVLKEREVFYEMQNNLIQNKDRRRINGVLFNNKSKENRVGLCSIAESRDAGFGFDILPKNATKLHFKTENVNKILTLDGAVVVPNSQNLVGITEICNAFLTLPSIEPGLLPGKWLENHFKWIVWKLNSYEKFSGEIMKGVLSVENLIQQLKYRYDREIDKSQRSALRKIFETDDVSQRRLILCVSDVFKGSKYVYEIELTDGWYSIRTVLDEPLCRQVAKQKIKIGTKLIIYGAELLNLHEGCHPLEANPSVRLKINGNNTRRAKWYTKLGYQRCPEPFQISIGSILPSGGHVGCIRFYLARIYPIQYLEKCGNNSVWRNKKAEDKRAQDWENEQMKIMEKIREDARSEGKTTKKSTKSRWSREEIAKISCAETLHEIWDSANDPELIQSLLSQEQLNVVVAFKNQLDFCRENNIAMKIKDCIKKRDVVAVLKLLVVDDCGSKHKNGVVFKVWNAELHSEQLKEGSVFYAYNIVARRNNELSSTPRTKFKLVDNLGGNFEQYRRHLTEISTIKNPFFCQIDTVGILVRMDELKQNFWLADSSKSLCFVKICDTPLNCSPLINAKIGEIVSASNLLFTGKNHFATTFADSTTILSKNPFLSHLQEGIVSLTNLLPKDLEMFVQECGEKIDDFIVKNIAPDSLNERSKPNLNPEGNLSVFEESELESAMSLIDVDKFY